MPAGGACHVSSPSKLPRGTTFAAGTSTARPPQPVAQAQPPKALVHSFAVRVHSAHQQAGVAAAGVAAAGASARAQSFGIHGLVSDVHRLEAMRRAMAESQMR